MFLLRKKHLRHISLLVCFLVWTQLDSDMYNGEDKSGDSLYIIVNK